MTPTQIFGPHLRDMMEYVGLLKTEEGKQLIREGVDSVLHRNTMYKDLRFHKLIDQAHTFLSQPMQESWFVRPAKPKCSHCENHNCGNNELGCGLIEDYEAWQNWQPLFLGEWRFDSDGDLMKLDKERNIWKVIADKEEWESFKDLNAFALHCAAKNIPLELNPEYVTPIHEK